MFSCLTTLNVLNYISILETLSSYEAFSMTDLSSSQAGKVKLSQSAQFADQWQCHISSGKISFRLCPQMFLVVNFQACIVISLLCSSISAKVWTKGERKERGRNKTD